jgi:DNA polymerase III subunit gamma/tau
VPQPSWPEPETRAPLGVPRSTTGARPLSSLATRVTYQALYRKYRSQSFGDLVGQEAMARALRGAIATNRVAHAYLFSGTRGTGKTTTARLLAKAVNCLDRRDGDSEPCNRCESCAQVQNGSALDLVEIDAASNRGIDEIRDLREKVNLAPALGRKKVYIIDEAHMLTTEAFNALLKTLEEPPEHVVFVLCTTESNKVPLTVLGRCQQFVFRRFNDEQIVGRLAHIAAEESILVEREALGLMAHVAQGSMRDAVGLLDQLVPLTEGTITLDAARDLLGITDPGQVDALLDLVMNGRAGEALAALGRVYEGGGELRQVVRGLMERCRDRLVRAIEDRDAGAREHLSAVLDALLHLDGEVRRHAEPRFLVEATLVRLAVEAVRAEPAAGAAARPVVVAVPPVVVPAVTPPPQRPVAPEAPAPAAPPRPAPVAPVAAVVPARPPVPESPPPELPVAEPAAPQPVPPSAVGGTAPPVGDLTVGWRNVLQSLNVKTRAFFSEARPQLEGDCLVLVFPYSFHHKQAVDSSGQVEPLVKAWLGASARLDLRLQDASPRPAQAVAARVLAPEEDPVIKAAERKLEAKVVRVRPLKEAT